MVNVVRMTHLKRFFMLYFEMFVQEDGRNERKEEN